MEKCRGVGVGCETVDLERVKEGPYRESGNPDV